MTTLKEMPEEIQRFADAHKLLQGKQLAEGVGVPSQQALARASEVVLQAFAEKAGQPDGNEAVWQLASQADTPQELGPQGVALVRAVLDDRYHGTLHRVANDAQVQPAAVGPLLEVAAGAALAIMGQLIATNQWTPQDLGQWLRPYHLAADPEAVGMAPALPIASAQPAMSRSGSWLASRANVLLLVVSFIAVAEFGYIVGTRSSATDTPPDTAALTPADEPATPAGSGRQYAALPVVNRRAAAERGGGRATVPVVLKLKNGLRQVIGASSTESKLYQFLIDPAKEVDMVDPTKDWIGFDRIYFESNKATLTNESLWQLSNVASILKRFPAAKIKIAGYTDASGNPLRNLQLSRERAKATKDALASMGVPADRLTAVGFGALDNIADNDTEEGRAVNRRVSMQVTQK